LDDPCSTACAALRLPAAGQGEGCVQVVVHGEEAATWTGSQGQRAFLALIHPPGRIPPGDQTFFEQEAIMAGTTEQGKPPAVVRVIELVGVSSEGWSDAARQVVARASQTLRHITSLDVVKSSAVVKEGKIIEYHVNVKLAFVIEGAEIEKP
jgi:flavin-binding protein dodecin